MKNKWLALVLSVVMPGLGYVYLGRKLFFGLLLLVADIAAIVWVFTTTNGFQSNPALVVCLLAYEGAIVLDTYYVSQTETHPPEKISVIPETEPKFKTDL